MGLVIRILPWDDQNFRSALDRALAEVAVEGFVINGPKAAARAEELLCFAGYPHARIDVERTVDEALAHAGRWNVRRDGYQA